jgi:hypothetical protein
MTIATMIDYLGNKSITVGNGSALCAERGWCRGVGEHMNPWRNTSGDIHREWEFPMMGIISFNTSVATGPRGCINLSQMGVVNTIARVEK